MLKNIKNSQKLKILKVVHMIIYLAMVSATFYVLYAGFNKIYNEMLYVSLGLLAVEIIVISYNGMRCPLTILAKKYGDSKGYAWDMLLSEKSSKYSFRLYGSLVFVGMLLLTLDYLNFR